MIEITVGQVAEAVGGLVEGRADKVLTGVAPLDAAGPDDLSWMIGPKYLKNFGRSRAGAVVVGRDLKLDPGRNLIRVEHPEPAFARAAQMFVPPRSHPGQVCAGAVVDPTAEVAAGATVYPLAYVGPGARIGPGAVIYPLAYVGPKANVGARTEIHPQAALLDGVKVGEDCLVQAGAVVGSDGFGFAQDPDGRHVKIPQMGGVDIGDRVELGANTTVDRAVYGMTRVGDGCKLDNLVQVAHNVQMGPDCAMAAQVGISGSVTIGRGSIFAGQVGLSDHIDIGERVSIAGGSGVSSDIPAGERWGGYPAMPAMQIMRIIKAWPMLPDLLHRVRDLEKRLAALEGGSDRREGE